MKRPLIAITMGDPAGIGSELCVKVLSKRERYERCRPLIIGSLRCIDDALNFTEKNDFLTNDINNPEEGEFEFGQIDVLDLDNVNMTQLKYGVVSAMCGKAAGEYIEKAIELALAHRVDATVTCPINKESFKLGGYGEKYVGHTEMYAALTKTQKYTMMLAHDNLRTVHVSTHVSLRKACDLVKRERVLEVIRIAYNVCKSLGIESPKIGVAALNPHGGEGGLFGEEEIKEIAPAIADAKREGIAADGPIPADTLYSKVKGGWYDMAVSMYHDQGHTPLKLAGFVWNEEEKKWTSVSGINITLGLPIIRVSVDHGTAFGKAGKGLASEESLINAIDYAIMFALRK